MNLKTTFLLIILTGVGAGAWYGIATRKVEEPASSTLTFLEESLTPDKVKRIEAVRGKETLFTLEKVGNDWVLPGKWPCRQQEADQIVALLCSLRSRYTPITLDDTVDMKPYGLSGDPLMVKITAGDETHTLRFGEEPGDTNRFTRPTFLRLNDRAELVRLGPGIAAALDRKLEHFQQRRLFPVERVARDKDTPGKDKDEQLDAAEVEVETAAAKFTIVKKDKDWVLKEAHRKKDKIWEPAGAEDRVDPDRLNGILRGFPDLWAEKFVDKKDKTLDDFGLKDPEYRLSAGRAGGAKMKLLVGRVSDTKISDKSPPPSPFGPPMPPRKLMEEYRYARLDGNDQVFEIKADKLADIAVALDSLRDAHLAHFKTDDVKRLEIRFGTQELILVKATEKDNDVEKERWRFEKPGRDEADAKLIEELLQKLADLQARDKDVLDNVEAKTVGLDKPAGSIKIALEEGKKDKKDDADKKDEVKKRDIVYQLGVKDKEKDKLYVRVDAWPRVNQIGGEFVKLAQRSDLAYRLRDLWRLDRDAVTRISIEAESPAYHLERKDKAWKLTPLDADVAGKVADDLAEDLAHLRCERFEAVGVKDFAAYGLDKPAFKIAITAKDGKPRAFEIGKTTDGGRFARLGGGDAVFVVSDKVLANVRKDPLDLLDRNLLTLNPVDIQRIRFEGPATFTLEQKKDRWQVLDSPVPAFTIGNEQVITTVLPFARLRADKFAAFGGKIDWNQYGLAKPTAKIIVTVKDPVADKGKDHVIEIGKEADKGGRFARIDSKDAVVVLDESTAGLLKRSYVDFVDLKALKFDLDAVTRIDRQMKDAPLELSRREDWQITKPGIRDADNLTIFDLLKRTAALQAKRVAAFPVKDLKEFGLDQPTAVVTLHLEDTGGKHVIKVGNLTKDPKDTDERYAIIDNASMVVVLAPELSRQLVAPVAFYADRNLGTSFMTDRAELTRGGRKLIFTRVDADWKLIEPAKADAESAELEDLVRSLQRLRVDEIVADKAADLKKYGLDQPAAEWRFKSGNAESLLLLVGAPENDKPGARRYAKLGDKAAIFLVNGKLAAKATAEYRSRKLWEPYRTAQADEITISGPEKPYTLTHKDGKWSVAGQPDKEVREAFLADTLGAMAYVRIKSYVADGKADLKAFGLDKPSWKIEVKAGKDKRELWLGSLEPGTKLFYATVPGSGTVFTIDALDSVVLARPLAELLVEEKKSKSQ